jgi:hypothetical protein
MTRLVTQSHPTFSHGRTESRRSQSSRECSYRKELDIETLL